MLKKYLEGKLQLDWILGLTLIFVFGLLRFFAVLYGIETGDNKYLSILFLTMILIPFAILSKKGKHYIKMKRPKNLLSLFSSFLLGVTICVAIYAIGLGLYGKEISNWFKYIGESYPIDLNNISGSDKQIFFFVFLGIGMTFSPFGEELFYRGLVHGCFLKKFGEKKSAMMDSAAFGLTHLAHFGIIYHQNAWSFYYLPALIWVILMFVTGLIFNLGKSISDSIMGAIVSHIGFNMAMTYLIFYKIF